MINPLNLQLILVNIVAGTPTIFLFLALIALALLAAQFRMNNLIFGMLILVFGAFMATWIPWFYALIIIVAGLAITYALIRIVKG